MSDGGQSSQGAHSSFENAAIFDVISEHMALSLPELELQLLQAGTNFPNASYDYAGLPSPYAPDRAPTPAREQPSPGSPHHLYRANAPWPAEASAQSGGLGSSSSSSSGSVAASGCGSSTSGSPRPHVGDAEVPSSSRQNGARRTGKDAQDLCLVCGDRASGYHYNALTCEGCKGFFRRSITKKASYVCKNGGACEMDMYMRRKCQQCRLRKCRDVGMLEECLLTDIQCQSKRMRKHPKRAMAREYLSENVSTTEGPRSAALPSSSICRQPVAELDEWALTVEQQRLVDMIVGKHRMYRIPHDTLQKFVFQGYWEGGNKEKLWEIATIQVQVLVEFTKNLPGFQTLDHEDQIALLKGSAIEAMILRSAQVYNNRATTPHAMLLNEKKMRTLNIAEEFIQPMFLFYRSMGDLNATETEYALLTATAILSADRPYVRGHRLIESLQEPLLDILYKLSKLQHRQDPQHFARLVGKLTELRTLNHNHSEVLMSWRLQDQKLTPLLCEIWDI